MAIELKVFYSWQSDLPDNTNRGFIQTALEGARDEIAKDVTTEPEPAIDRDTSGVSGSPDIRQTIFAKIESCDVFAADVFIIGKATNRSTSNPNVLIELGYALKGLGDNRILLILNEHFGCMEELPFLRKREFKSFGICATGLAGSQSARCLQSADSVFIPGCQPGLVAIHNISHSCFAFGISDLPNPPAVSAISSVYALAMKRTTAERLERLIRVRASRRENPVELQVHYAFWSENDCQIYQILAINDGD